MFNQKGASFLGKSLRIVIVFAIILTALFFINKFTGGSVESYFKDITFTDANFNVSEMNLTSYSKILENDRAVVLDYVFGKVPIYLAEKRGGIEGRGKYSAVIIMLGIWFLFFFAFADILSLFGTFNKFTALISAFILTIIFVNLKLTTYISVVLMRLTADIGKFAIVFSVLIILLIFILSSLGVEWIRNVLEERKKSEEKLKASIKGAKVSAGIEAAERFGEAVAERE